MPEMRELLEMVNCQNWEHLFDFGVSHMDEEELKVFYHNLEISTDGLYLTSQVNGVHMALDEETLSEIVGVVTVGIRSIKSGKGSAEFLKLCGAKDFNSKGLRGEFQLLFELVKEALLPRSDKDINPTSVDLFLMEILFKYKKINLSAIVIEYMNSVINAKAGKHVLPYGF